MIIIIIIHSHNPIFDDDEKDVSATLATPVELG